MKFFKHSWDQIGGQDDLQPEALDRIRLVLRWARTASVLNRDPLGAFFSAALRPYYCWGKPPMLPVLAGNTIYRISDLVPEERRRTLTVVTDFTLEDWRVLWLAQFEKGEEAIPCFAGGDPPTLPGLADGR